MCQQPPQQPEKGSGKLWLLWPVILAGESIFLLPFVLPRLFRPTMLEAWGVNNLDFGLAFTCYGLVAIAAYGLGGPLADRFPPRWLMCMALAATAFGGTLLLGQPQRLFLCCIYAYFGVTTILLFWSAMLKVTHTMGGTGRQATAFGLLDAGRGLFAAVIATALTLLFSRLLPAQEQNSPEDLAQALRIIVTTSLILVLITALIVPLALVAPNRVEPTASNTSLTLRSVTQLIRRPTIWLHGLLVLCAYCGFKSIDNYGIFAVDVFGATDLEASQLTTLTFWARPLAAVTAGMVADRFNHFISMATLFILAALGNLSLIFLVPQNIPWFCLAMVAVTTAATMYGLRGIYFSVFDDLEIPSPLVGTAAGMVSLIGFLPDVFFGTLTGFLIDSYPGRIGHQLVFALVCVISVLGLCTCLWNARRIRRLKHAVSDPT